MVKTTYTEFIKMGHERISKNFDKRKADIFFDYVKSIYGEHKIICLSGSTMWRLFDNHMKVIKKNQHQVYGAFGRGGVGKSTLMKNILYFHDPTFDHSRVVKSMDSFAFTLCDVLKMKDNGRYKAILIDEPSQATHQASMSWRLTEDVLGQIRQANLFIGVCATELRNIKPSLYSLITGLCAFTKPYVYDYYNEDKHPGITGEISKEYKKTNTYQVFYNPKIKKYAGPYRQWSYKRTPIDNTEGQYLKDKREEFMKSVNKLKKITEGKDPTTKPKTTRVRKDSMLSLILDKREAGMSSREIGKQLNLSHNAVLRRIAKVKEIPDKLV